jgi:hypothetical protein
MFPSWTSEKNYFPIRSQILVVITKSIIERGWVYCEVRNYFLNMTVQNLSLNG